MPNFDWSPHYRLTRRTLSLGVLGALAIPTNGLARQNATATPSSSGDDGVQPDGTWVFTDDRGIRVTLPAPPERVIAGVFAAAPLWDFGVRPVGIFGWNINADGTLTAAGGSIDPGEVEILNGDPNMLDAEKAVAVGADLIVTVTFSPDDPDSLWGIAQGTTEQATAVAPIIAISGLERADRIAERFAHLAHALGTDLDDPAIGAQEDDFEAAGAALVSAIKAVGMARAIFAYPDVDQVYLANPQGAADVQLFASLGLDALPQDTAPGESWVEMSYEEVPLLDADLFFYAQGEGTIMPEEIQAHPTLSQHPAVLAGRLFPWQQDVVFSYAGLAQIVTGVANAVESLGQGTS